MGQKSKFGHYTLRVMDISRNNPKATMFRRIGLLDAVAGSIYRAETPARQRTQACAKITRFYPFLNAKIHREK